MFENLYSLDPSHSQFRDHNYKRSPQGKPEQVPEFNIKFWLGMSCTFYGHGYKAKARKPRKHNSTRIIVLAPKKTHRRPLVFNTQFDSQLDSIFKITRTSWACDRFLISEPAHERDYYLSKLFQFIWLIFEACDERRPTPDKVSLSVPVLWAARSSVEGFLDSIPDEKLRTVFNWHGLRHELCNASGLEGVRRVLNDLGRFLPAVRDLSASKSALPEAQKDRKSVSNGAAAIQPSAQRKPVPVRPFSTPAGAGWGDVSIRFTSDHAVQITAAGVTEVRNYVEMGFEDRRKETPCVAWKLLIQFARTEGVIRSPGSDGKTKDWSRVEKGVQSINQSLKTLFGLRENPIFYDRREKGYLARFTVSFPGADLL